LPVARVGYLPFLPDFLPDFAFLSLAIMVSYGRVDAAQRRRSVWSQRAARAPSAQVDSPKFMRRERLSPGLRVSTETRLDSGGERREIDLVPFHRGRAHHAVSRRPVRGAPLEIADELRPMGVAQELPDRKDLADVESVVVRDALDRVPHGPLRAGRRQHLGQGACRQ
jgi:hypothetical protein